MGVINFNNFQSRGTSSLIAPPTALLKPSGPSPASASASASSSLSTPSIKMAAASNMAWVGDAVAFFSLMVGTGLGTVLLLYVLFSPMTPEQREGLHLPLTLAAAQRLAAVLEEFVEVYFANALLAHAAIYLYLQTFAIPGTVFVNLVAGAVLGMWTGFFLGLCYNVLGSCFLYGLSYRFGKRFVERYFPIRMEKFRQWAHDHRGELLYQMTFARLFPFTPNWFLNVACGQLGTDLRTFAAALALGLSPYNFLSTKAGVLIGSLTSTGDIVDRRVTWALAVVAVLGVIGPPLAKRLDVQCSSRGDGKKNSNSSAQQPWRQLHKAQQHSVRMV